MYFYSFNHITKNISEIVKQNKDKIVFPCIILEKDYFNDLQRYRTTFLMTYFESSNTRHVIGKIRVMDYHNDDTNLSGKFEAIHKNYCSIGQSTMYYINLYRYLGKEKMEKVLFSLNDAIYCKDETKDLQNTDIFNKSLLRFSEAKKLFIRGKNGLLEDIKIFNKESIEYTSEPYIFSFECTINGANKAHKIHFDFRKHEYLPYRIHTIIGNNGTGKSKVLSNMAKILSGKTMKDTGEFSTYNFEKDCYISSIPVFRKIICISYSPFDYYPESDTYSYIHRSIMDYNKKDNIQATGNIVKNEFATIKEKNREKDVFSYIIPIINSVDNDYSELLYKYLHDPYNGEIINNFSSGQMFLINTIINIVANVESDSLILLDEPDLYLHPNLISEMIRSLNIILERYHSFAVISTHSVFVLQNMPSRYVSIFKRDSENEPVQALTSECFGASVSSISKEIFNIDEKDKYYIEYLDKMAKELTVEKVSDIFNNNLGFGASVYIEAKISSRSKKIEKDK